MADRPTGAANGGVAEAGNDYSAIVEIARFHALVPIAGVLTSVSVMRHNDHSIMYSEFYRE